MSSAKTFSLAAGVALALALPGGAAAHSNHGLHCGWHHTKHTRAIGKTCVKHHHHAPTRAHGHRS